ncbi:unnamed protein product, partial [Timema podura]|nr:unnamed protein product [Timema podura]
VNRHSNPASTSTASGVQPGKTRGLSWSTQGRDHGVPDYMTWFRQCSQTVDAAPGNYSELLQAMSPLNINTLRETYSSNLEDVDLIVGGSLETPVYGAVLGPTLVCVLAHQFAKVRNSDRFWYENDIPPSSFNR